MARLFLFSVFLERGMTMDWTSSDGRMGLTITTQQALDCARPGDNGPNVEKLAAVREIAEQLDKLSPADVVTELDGYGAWSEHELANHGANRLRLLWLACHDVIDEAAEAARYPGGRGD
jgi:hypothetical protein